MATTTNYGWETPDDTDLVKDGAAAIRTLGSSIDTTTKNLNPETTLGDIAYRSSTSNTNTRLAIGTNGQVLTVAAGVPSWATAAGYTPLPGFRAQPSTSQSINAGTWTKITLGNEIFDTNNKFASSTFTPTVAGYYTFTLHYVMNGGNQVFETAIYKNGAVQDSLYWGTSGYPGRTMSSILYLDSDDYVEMYVKTDLTNSVMVESFFAGLGVRE